MKSLVTYLIFCIIVVLLLITIFRFFGIIDLDNNGEYEYFDIFISSLSAVSTLVLGYISLRQNETLSLINKEMSDNTVKASASSKLSLNDMSVSFTEYKDSLNIFDENMFLFSETDDDRLLTFSDKNTSRVSFVIHFLVKNDIPLESCCIKEMMIFNDKSDAQLKNVKNMFLPISQENNSLKYGEHNDVYSYSAHLLFSNKELNSILKEDYLFLLVKLEIRNIFNVVVDMNIHMHLFKSPSSNKPSYEYNITKYNFKYNKVFINSYFDTYYDKLGVKDKK